MKAHQLKNAILQLAVQGKLVPQNPNDEPASKLLERIAAEKQRRIKAGEIKKDKRDSTIVRRGASFYEISNTTERCIDDELPFDLPKGWEWARLGAIGDWGSGATPSRTHPEYYNGDIPWLKTGDLTDSFIESIPECISQLALKKTSVRLNETGSVLMAMYGATIGKLGILTFPATTNQACCACKPLPGIEALYLFYFLMSQRAAFIKRGEGGAQPNISKEKIVSTLIPIPPLAEQRRIVNRLESLLPLVEAYGKAEAELSELDARFPDMLKKSILQDAVQGKLVPQDPNDEPASVLLERIRAEKRRLIKEGKIKKDKHESVIFRRDNSHYEKLDGVERCIDGEIPFEIPENWGWVRHNDLFEISGGSQPPKSKFISEARDGYIRLYQIRDYGNNPVPVYIPISAASKISHKGDILLARYGASLGKVFWAEDGAYNVAMARVIPQYKTELISKKFLFLFYQSSLYQSVIHANSRSAQAGFNKEDLSSLLFPLPPLSEQHRIVQRIEELLPLIKGL